MRKYNLNQARDYLDNFKDDNWAKLSEKERLKAYQSLENEMAKEQGRPARRIVDKNLNSNECGYYRYDRPKKLYINEDYLKSDDPLKRYDGMNTIIHEGRHAYQDDCMKGKVSHNEDKETLELWRKNKEVYIPYSNGYSKYRFQPLEIDSNDFASAKMNSFSRRFNSDSSFQSYIDNLNFTNSDDAKNAEKYLGSNYKQNIINEIDYYCNHNNKMDRNVNSLKTEASPKSSVNTVGIQVGMSSSNTDTPPVTATDTSKASPIPNEDKPKGTVDTDKNNNFYDAKVPSNKDKDTDPLTSNLDKQNNGMKM